MIFLEDILLNAEHIYLLDLLIVSKTIYLHNYNGANHLICMYFTVYVK